MNKKTNRINLDYLLLSTNLYSYHTRIMIRVSYLNNYYVTLTLKSLSKITIELVKCQKKIANCKHHHWTNPFVIT